VSYLFENALNEHIRRGLHRVLVSDIHLGYGRLRYPRSLLIARFLIIVVMSGLGSGWGFRSGSRWCPRYVHTYRTVRWMVHTLRLNIGEIVLSRIHERRILGQRHAVGVVHLIVGLLLVAEVQLARQGHAVAFLRLGTRFLHHLHVTVTDVLAGWICEMRLVGCVPLQRGRHHDRVLILMIDVDDGTAALRMPYEIMRMFAAQIIKAVVMVPVLLLL
jgi:hypothetical protein